MTAISTNTEFEYIDRNHEIAVFVLDPAGGRNFDGLHFHRARLNGRDLRGATFRGTDLRGALFHDSDLKGADFTGANLINTHFEDAILQNAILRDCVTIGTMLYKADLRGADLTGSDPSGFQSTTRLALEIKGARYDDATRWPEGVDPEALGAILSE